MQDTNPKAPSQLEVRAPLRERWYELSNLYPISGFVSIIFTWGQVEEVVQLPGLSLAPHVRERALVLHSSRKAPEIAPGRYHPSYPANER